ncbi:MAG TPA: Flp pilus assembly protein CpaB [Acidobacteriaceae bacterium]|nr:Flp pilus assembly protein CpaB [Acidobacteriaceae bacterium]
MNLRKLAVAFAIALAVSGLCTLALSRRIFASATEHKPAWRYVAPARPLEANEVLKPDSLTLIDWPGKTEVPGAFTRPADLVGRTVLYPIQPGEPLTDKLVSSPGAGAGLAGRIPQGMRAIALRTDEVIGVAGFMQPGSRLDVLATYRSDKSPDPVTVTVLQDAEVLAVGHQTQPDPDGKAEPASITVVTLLLTPQDAEKAVMASTQGAIHFIMRSGSDSRLSNSTPVQLSALSGSASPQMSSPRHIEGRPRRSATAATRVFTVDTILGDKEVTKTFRVTAQ